MEQQNRDNIVAFYFSLGMCHKEILCFLKFRHNIIISERQLKRILKKLNLYRKKKFSSLEEVFHFIQNEVEGSSNKLHGYKWMHLKCLQHGLVVTQNTVRRLLHIIDPVGVDIRSRKRLRRRQYYNKGPNYLWHIDSYDKLKPYGIGINGCIDGFSRYIIWLKATFTNSNPRVIGGHFIKAIELTSGCPHTIRSDLGTENSFVKRIQTYLRSNENNSEDINNNLPPFISGSSQHNQRIEAWWSILRKHNSQFWMNLFEDLKNTNYFNGGYLDKNLIQFCFMPLIQDELDLVVLEWNTHKISKAKNSRAPTGKPIVMYNIPELYNTTNYSFNVMDEELQEVKEGCLFIDHEIISDKNLFDLCKIIMEENIYQKPETPYEAVNLYINLRNSILSLL